MTEPQHPPVVSVVTPFYNTAAYLAECIESVLSQQGVPFEFLLVNNQSTDGSREIARAYAAKDPRIRLLDNPAFVGQVENYNGALERIDPVSRFVKIVQADDRILPDCLRRMVDVAEQDPRIGLVTSHYRMGDETCGLDFPFTSSKASGRDVCRDMLLSGRFFVGSPTTVMYRADVVRSRRPFYALGRYHEDTEAAYEILLEHDLGFVPDVLSVMRVDNASLTGATRRFEGDMLDRLINIERYGARVLGPEEFEALRTRQWDLYNHLIGTAALRFREKAFWEYHRRGLATIGRQLRWHDVARDAGRQLVYLARQPFRTGVKRVARTALTLLNRTTGSRLRSGEWVEVRSKQEILRTLDSNGRLDGLPFMPQMFQYCGTRLQVFKRAHKTCDTIQRSSRRMDLAVHLDDVRCDGRAYGECAAGCLIFWKEAWLKPVAGESPEARAESLAAAPSPITEEAVAAGTRAPGWTASDPRYACQATQLLEATRALPSWDVRQFLEDYESGNVDLRHAVAGIARVALRPLMRRLRDRTGAALCTSLNDAVHSPDGGALAPNRPMLGPGDFVRVRPSAGIVEMVQDGGVYSVRSRVERLIDVRTGRSIPVEPGSVILNGLTCKGDRGGGRAFCPRAILPVVRETWLEREPPCEHHP